MKIISKWHPQFKPQQQRQEVAHTASVNTKNIGPLPIYKQNNNIVKSRVMEVHSIS